MRFLLGDGFISITHYYRMYSLSPKGIDIVVIVLH
jgi:hypothetical protein